MLLALLGAAGLAAVYLVGSLLASREEPRDPAEEPVPR